MKNNNLFSQNLRSIPKIDLHRHLDCSVRWSTLVELAPQVGIHLAETRPEQLNQFLILEPMTDLGAVLRKFSMAQKVLASEEILARITYEACEDAFNDGVRVLELRYSPTFIADGHSSLDYKKIHRSIQKGIELAQKKLPMAVGLICIVQRTKPLEAASQVIDFAIDNNSSFLAVDLADNEAGSPPKPFASLFQRAKSAGLKVTTHGGEIPTDSSAQWVKDSIEYLGAERIGHGVHIMRDPAVLDFVRSHNVTLEICPISNYLTQSFSCHEDHPIRKLIAAGIKVTINSDDPGIFGTNLSDDYEILHRVHNFTIDDFKRCNQIAFEASFISEQEKLKFKKDFFDTL